MGMIQMENNIDKTIKKNKLFLEFETLNWNKDIGINQWKA